ncbi:MAG: DUF924 family protein [Alphaproteobacteria bacterium]
MAGSEAARLQTVLDFWFGPPDGAGAYQSRSIWFKSTPAFDAELKQLFLADHERAASGGYDALANTPHRVLALLILLDQFPRNAFRGTRRMYATDALALALAERAIALDFDQIIHHVARIFFFTPFEHAEDIAVQRRSLALAPRMSDAPNYEHTLLFIQRHAEIVERFGRFPHRNETLGRATTAEETEFLKEPHSSF